MAKFKIYNVVTCLLVSEGKVLIVRRSDKVSTYQGLWSGISGYINPGENPLQRAVTEIEEETKLKPSELKLICSAGSFDVDDAELKRTWGVHLFAFGVLKKRIRLDYENTEYRWVSPEEISDYRTVPGLEKAFGLLFK